ncbi:phage baseplate plug family protein [Caballeronia grimmiae]|uniref:Cyanophage baseplate Pam3 plug gp18 domain-containing protein n=1 Tax=Caballeronia grimmiae TaxID=1071679 RepID=A0ABQ1RA50_9BURK|nr:hypothetical protein [Caballeronia grimmiae]GGD61339.1 hypothetical protein GCM10010985_14250 [Caballeronia grimmiae]
MLTIPLAATPSQRLSVALAQQSCGLAVYQKHTGLYLDLYVAGHLVMAGALCRNLVYLVRAAYLDFVGDLAFVDTAGDDDPEYSGLGTRCQLLYFELIR